jgi:uncharacterized protein (TIGR02118 family)
LTAGCCWQEEFLLGRPVDDIFVDIFHRLNEGQNKYNLVVLPNLFDRGMLYPQFTGHYVIYFLYLDYIKPKTPRIMKRKLVLSFLLLTICFTAFSQEKKAASDKGLIKISILYPYSEGKTFNMEYYEAKHMPMVAGYLGSNLVKYTIDKGIPSGIPGQPLLYMAVGTFYVKNLSEYNAAIAPNLPAIREDFPKYTNVLPTAVVTEVIR